LKKKVAKEIDGGDRGMVECQRWK